MSVNTKMSDGDLHLDSLDSDLMCLDRVKTEIPVIGLGCEYFTRLIASLKESSAVVEWSLNKATTGVDNVVKFPYVKDQLLAIDRLLCSSLDLTELSLPVLTKTPQEMYDGSIEYVIGIVTPITNWVDLEFLPSAEYYINQYLPELDSDQKIKFMNSEKGPRACQLSVKLARRIKQHAYAEPKYFVNLMYSLYEESILLTQIFVFEPKLLPKTFCQIWKKLGDGVTPVEVANSLLLVEMGCLRLREGASLLIKMIEITEQMAKYYIEMFLRYVYEQKNHVVYNLSRVVQHQMKKQEKNQETMSQHENVETKTINENTNGDEHSTPQNLID
ncbi:uncharacterized protein LOC114118942 isoform X1 [Aphis gossypii]|uniref:Uncharacterized protein n=1 Tax=Aphis gossypii TaxID=80765 RepID=A0A9P0NNN5_APHGO|nr:uncharacterized protein LOC114118942 isoform X1 [Aphis gossypii]CAH1735983.1 unnamed protein product [Aphis gossypii]